MQTEVKKRSIDQTKFKSEAISNGVHTSHLMELFEKQLKDILWVEKALIRAFPKMVTLATSVDLILALIGHLHRTREQVTRLVNVFNIIDKKPTTNKCFAMEGLIAEATEMMGNCEKGPKCDAGIIAAAQKIEHYEIATYGTLRKFAETLGLGEAETLLMETLKEEREADQKLTEVAVYRVNMEAAFRQT